ncbi:hypothetical protein MMC18_002009 [Xylographa bjoerkii]|nr:hypothetical protein [Xylographa bjoerkii]
MRVSQCLSVNQIDAQKATRYNKFTDERGRYDRNGARGVASPYVPAHQSLKRLPNKSHRTRRGPLIVGGLAVYCVVCYGTYLYISLGTKTSKTDIPEDVSDRYNFTARTFDKDVDTTEKLMGLGWLRRSLTRQASGHVLEISVGTGRNLKYYDLTKCSSITFVDQSAEMINIARQKFNGTHEARMLNSPGTDTYPHYQNCRFLTQSAHDPIPRAAPAGFDTIIQTMGICSTSDPSTLLSHLGRLTNPTNGRILLLEHGRSHYDWVNKILDDHAPAHADRHGCWWNKDIQKILQDSDLEIVQIKRYHFGTTWWIELKPKAGRVTPFQQHDFYSNPRRTGISRLAPAHAQHNSALRQLHIDHESTQRVSVALTPAVDGSTLG